MKIINGVRQSGKSTELLRSVDKAEGECLIVCPSLMHVKNLQIMVKDLGLKKKNIMTIHSLIKNEHKGMKWDKVYFDELEQCLTFLTNIPVEAIVTCGDLIHLTCNQ